MQVFFDNAKGPNLGKKPPRKHITTTDEFKIEEMLWGVLPMNERKNQAFLNGG